MRIYVFSLLLLGLLPQLQGWVQVSKECEKGCEERGMYINAAAYNCL
jgi:hypothetical protein